MKNFLLMNATRILFLAISILLFLRIIALVEEQSAWNIVHVMMLSISWISFLLFVLIKRNRAEEV
ncbi:hypothetical protein ACERII_19520 [Evansella sp. AB-rgal1]|uniref:hypothetical protein n=1 Tax=Evansella sp. AB-rgal1 TaxID=3242696 RepID=UPI00359E5B7F